jgi:formate transporter
MSEITAADLASLKPDALAPAAIEAKAEDIAVGKTKLTFAKCFALAMAAGFFIALGATYFLLITSDASLSFTVKKVLGGLGFCLGLLLVICAGAELFTGNSLMVTALFSKKITIGALLKNWGIVFVGNLVGSLIAVFLLFMANFQGCNSDAVGTAMVTVATAKIAAPWITIFFKGVMCNILVCLAVWMAFGARTFIDKLAVIVLPISAFVACGFEHCVANMFFLPMGYVAKLAGYTAGTTDISALNIGGILYNISAATLGNIVGGVVFVGLLYWFVYAKREHV